MSKELRKSIIEALKALPLHPDTRETKLRYHAHRIEIDLYSVAQVRRKPSTPKKVVKQLDDYRKALKNLTQKVEGLSVMALRVLETTYVSEEMRGAFRGEARRIAGNIYLQPEPSALGKLPDCLLPNCHEYLLHATRHAADNLRKSTRDKRGRQSNAVPHWLASRLAETYFELTGEEPSRRTD